MCRRIMLTKAHLLITGKLMNWRNIRTEGHSISDESISLELGSCIVILCLARYMYHCKKRKNNQQRGFAGGHPPNY